MSSGESTDGQPSRREVLDGIAEPVVALDATGAVTYADDEATAVLETAVDSVVGAHIDDIVPGADAQPSAAVDDALASGDPTTFTFDGPAGRRVEARVSPGEDGVSLLLVTRDDDARSPLRFQRIVEYLPVAVGCTSVADDGYFSFVNDALVEMFGAQSAADIKGRPVSDLYADPADRAALYEALQSSGRVAEREIDFERLDGTRFHGAVTATIEDVDGDEYILKIIQDITARREREAELRRKSRAIQEAPIGVTISDPDQPDNPMTYVNDGFVDITGYPREEALGRNCRFLQGEDTDPEAVAAMREAVDNHEEVAVELRNYRKDGTEFWNRVTISPVEDDDGTLLNFVGFQEDITERKAYESRLESQRDNLGTLNEVLRHDIRNDLQLILTYGELLADSVDTENREYVDGMLESAENAVSLTSTARDMADVMLNRASDLEPISLRRSLEQTIDEVGAAHGGAVIRVDGQLPSVTVRANDMLDSVFRNIIKNAIQHNDADVPEVTVSATTDADAVEVAVADNGPGVPDDQKEAIFGKGEKGLESQGTGLGLYLVRTLVDIYDGDVWVGDNDPGGAVFTVRLPAADRE